MEEIMSNQDYWQQRAERNLQAVEDIAVDYNLELAKEYKKVIKELQEELMLFYAKYAEENKISLEMAKKRLSGKELSEFKVNKKTIQIPDDWKVNAKLLFELIKEK